MRRNNHYVPEMYLKRWSVDGQRVWIYRLLVPSQNVPDWKLQSIRGIAYHRFLYVKIAAGGETDEFERWLEKEYETPAAEALELATTGRRLTRQHWMHLIRFVGAQDVRTPARLYENMLRWRRDVPNTLDEILRDLPEKIADAKRKGRPLKPEANPFPIPPIKVSKEVHPGGEKIRLKAELNVGREFWLWQMRHLLKGIAKVLLQHKWKILTAPDNVEWVTSDDPVIRLNYASPKQYDFKGGWGSKGTEIFLPLSPKHLIYTQIGKRPNLQGEIHPDAAKLFQKLIVEHAHRMLIGKTIDQQVPLLRGRTVDQVAFAHERGEWEKWHREQSEAEREQV
ncbi:MAG: DUF4238 domain-containing protein [Bacteroidetes bacterium]|nr:DUF4238 domain-containing protein [Bacteroidota bacterium]MCW5897610.1 DUF4238 domain-containing protein [Bacteroidota bacterium]